MYDAPLIMTKFVPLFMSVNMDTIEENLVSELRLSTLQAKVFVLVVKKGKMNAKYWNF